MNCPKCNGKISELDEKCPKCGLNFEEYEKEQVEERQEIEEETKTKGLLFINAAQLVGSIILALKSLEDEKIFQAALIFASSIILFFFIKGFKDIIDLLDSINKKLDK